MGTSRRHHYQITFLLILGAFLAGRLCFWLLPGLFETWEAKAMDRLFLFKTTHFPASYNDTVVHVDITDATLKTLGTFYLNRSHYAQVIENLADMNVSAQMYDFIFAAPSDSAEDQALMNATKAAGNVYFGMAFDIKAGKNRRYQRLNGESARDSFLAKTDWDVVVDGNPDTLYQAANPLITFPELASVSAGLGFLNLEADPDGVNRRIPLLVRYNGAYYPSFAFQGICDYLNVPPSRVVVNPGNRIILKDPKAPDDSPGGDITIPIDKRGRMRIHFIGPWDRMKHYNFADIFFASDDQMELELWRDELAGKITLISEVTTGTADLGPVPTDPNFLAGGIHASTLHTILQDSFLTDLSGMKALMVEGILLTLLYFFSLGLSSLKFTVGTLGMATAYVGIASMGFLYANLVFPLVQPLLMLTFAVISIISYRFIKEERERHFIRATFGRYLSREVVNELLNSPQGLEMSGENREVTFLVSDLRGFTSVSAQLKPHEVIHILNDYFGRMVEIIVRYRGTIDELQGDGILVFFGAPLRAEDDAERAVACAIDMQRAMPEINELQRQKNLPELSMGIGINTGEVVVGNIGSEKRTKYGAVGTPINTTYRIESHTVAGQILISHATYERVNTKLTVRDTTQVQFKGIDQPMTLYDILGIEGKYNLALSEVNKEALTALETPLRISCFVIEGKTVSKNRIQGRMTHVSLSEAQVLLETVVPLRSNLNLVFHPHNAPALSQIYAKVIGLKRLDKNARPVLVKLNFTSLPADASLLIQEMIPEVNQ